jgi:predicted enzyme related to lactoylglutathione lyase
MANPFVHIELQTQDLEKSKKFYAGMFDSKLEEIPHNWLPYIMVDDVAASTKKAHALGAMICKDVTEIPDMGWFSVITDPSGLARSYSTIARDRTVERRKYMRRVFIFNLVSLDGYFEGRLPRTWKRSDVLPTYLGGSSRIVRAMVKRNRL